jgi:hypothetical protein
MFLGKKNHAYNILLHTLKIYGVQHYISNPSSRQTPSIPFAAMFTGIPSTLTSYVNVQELASEHRH